MKSNHLSRNSSSVPVAILPTACPVMETMKTTWCRKFLHLLAQWRTRKKSAWTIAKRKHLEEKSCRRTRISGTAKNVAKPSQVILVLKSMGRCGTFTRVLDQLIRSAYSKGCSFAVCGVRLSELHLIRHRRKGGCRNRKNLKNKKFQYMWKKSVINSDN